MKVHKKIHKTRESDGKVDDDGKGEEEEQE